MYWAGEEILQSWRKMKANGELTSDQFDDLVKIWESRSAFGYNHFHAAAYALDPEYWWGHSRSLPSAPNSRTFPTYGSQIRSHDIIDEVQQG